MAGGLANRHKPRIDLGPMRGAPKKSSTEAIVAAAASIFAEKGVAGTSVEDIARAAGIAKGTFYLYFPTKDELVDALFSPQAEALEAALGAASGGGGKAGGAEAGGARLASVSAAATGPAKPTVKAIAEALLAFFGEHRLFLAELRAAYRGGTEYGFVERARRALHPFMAAYYRRDPRYPVLALDAYAEILVGATLDLLAFRLLDGRVGGDVEALVMLQDLLKRFFDCEQ